MWANACSRVGARKRVHWTYQESVIRDNWWQDWRSAGMRSRSPIRLTTTRHDCCSADAAFASIFQLGARAPLRGLYPVRIRRTDLRIDLESLTQALPRPRRVRTDPGARHLHGRHGNRGVAR